MPQALSPIEILTKLVSFPTVSSQSNLPLIDWVDDYLAQFSIECHRFYHPTEPKAALFAHVGPIEDGGVLLSGHTDVVPVEGQDWSTDPFVLTEKDGLLYGRGSCDMKGFDALAIWAMVEAKKAGVKRPLQIALSFDEELGCTGAPPMIERIVQTLPKAESVIVGEPSMMRVVTSHKGSQAHMTRIVGHEVHSSTPHLGVSAILEAGRLIDWVNSVNAENQLKTPTEVDLLFEPSHSTAHIGTIHGGTAQNITAGECVFGVDFRVNPSENGTDYRDAYIAKVRAVEKKMQATCPDTRIEVAHTFSVTPLRPERDGPSEALARAITGDNSVNVVSYATEAGQFQDAGYSACVCGPGDIAQAHQADEFISIAQMSAGQDFLETLISKLM